MPGKCAITLHSCISITDQINEQKKSIGNGSLYVQTEFEVNQLSYSAEKYGEFEPQGVSDVATLAES